MAESLDTSVGSSQANIPGIPGTAQVPALPYNPSSLPIQKVQDLIPSNWNKLFKYNFTINKAVDGLVTGKKEDIDGFNSNFVELFIAPNNITISSPFAINVSATNNGILEENNGTIFRNITLSGTTGVAPQRSVIKNSPELLGKILNAIAPGVGQSINSISRRATSFASSITGKSNVEYPPIDKFGEITSGYFQFWALYNFFVAYAETKKRNTQDSPNLRLVFNSPKDNIGYVCTPVSFELRRDAASPLQYRYNIVLKSWSITTPFLGTAFSFFDGVPSPDNVSAVLAITNTLKSARSVINGARNILSAVHSDFVNIMNVYTQTTLALKELCGVVQDIRDFSTIVQNNAAILIKGSTNSLISTYNSAVTGVPGSNVQKIPFSSVDEKSARRETSAQTNQTIAAATSGGTLSSSHFTSQIGTTKTPGGEDRTESSYRQDYSISILNNALASNDAFLDQPLSALTIPSSVQKQIDDQVTTALNTTSNQVRELIGNIQEISDNHAVNFGMMDAQYAKTYNLNVNLQTDKTPTEDDILTAVSLIEAKNSFTSTLATGQIFKERNPDPFLAANQALATDDQVTTPSSSYPVIFERGSSLEKMAQKYLGDPNRAREIAILNDLKAPYIDENGFQVSIIDANGRTFVVNSNQDLAINQVITLNGTSVASSRRRILNIEPIGGIQYRITVDGNPNLSIYTPSSNPYLKTRLPGTIGGGDVVLIPSGEPVVQAAAIRPTPLQSRLSAAEKVFKVDFATNEKTGDLLVTPNGDIQRSYGYANAAQAIRLALTTEKKELEQHPNFGLGLLVGLRNSDISLNDLQHQIQTVIETDPRFASADVTATIDGSVIRFSVTANGAKGTGLIPVDFEVGLAA